MLLVGVKHSRQQRETDCLVACCSMILDYLQVPNNYDQLTKLLDAQDFGTVFSNVQKLTAWGLAVTIYEKATLSDCERYLSLGLPVIVAVNTWTLLHWEGIETQHALIIVGLDMTEQTVYVLDPFFAQSPLELPLNQFEPAWVEMGRQFAVISLAEIDEA